MVILLLVSIILMINNILFFLESKVFKVIIFVYVVMDILYIFL